MPNLSRRLPILALLFLSISTIGQSIPQRPGRDLMPLADVKEGMKGTARTVFHGSKAEEFGVEILGVVPGGIGPKQDLIIGRLSGENAERTRVFAGMSGSPVYVDGKLVGAISYSFPYAKEPICGITPIEQMVTIFDRPAEPARLGGGLASYAAADLMSADWRRIAPMPPSVFASNLLAARTDSSLAAAAGQTFQPIATPLAFGGVSRATLDAFASDLTRAGMIGVTTAGSSGDGEFKQPTETTLLGGDSVVAHLSRGDLSLSAAGTVTWRDGNKIYAFGHPFYGFGSSELPMSESHVITVVPSVNNSFKLAVADAMVGTITQDRATGIYGQLGREPKMLPVEARIRTSRGRDETFKFESAIDDFLTPLIVNIGVLQAIVGNERQIGDMTIDVSGVVNVKGQAPVRIERRFSGPAAPTFAASSSSVALAALLKSTFDKLEVTGVKLDLKVTEGSSVATLERVSLDRVQVKAGETVNAILALRGENGIVKTMNVPVTIPADASPGDLTLTVAEGTAVQEASPAKQFTPRDPSELVAMLNSLRRTDRLYLVLSRPTAGAVIGASELPNLPPSMTATLNSDRTAGGSKATTSSTILEVPIASDLVLGGSQNLTIEVVK